MVVIAHNYQSKEVQELSDATYGTSDIIRNASRFKGQQVIICAVLYMAEDFYVMSDGQAEVYIPQIMIKNGLITHPRCPMIVPQGISETVSRKQLQLARQLNSDMVLVYINTPIYMKSLADGVYNATVALKVINRIAQQKHGIGKIVLIGDDNVNKWIQAKTKEIYPDFEVVSFSKGIFCPIHANETFTRKIISHHKRLINDYQDVGLTLHAEVNDSLRNYGFKMKGFFGGSKSIIEKVKQSQERFWVVATEEGAVDQLRRDTKKHVYSATAVCPNMKFTSPSAVKKAINIIKQHGPIADIIAHNKEPYYTLQVHQKRFVIKRGNSEIVPAVKLSVEKSMVASAKKSLSLLL